MKLARAFLLRLRGVFDKRGHEREMADEMESHLAFHIEDNLRAGMSAAEARRVALVKLGGMDQTKEMIRDRRSLPMLETFLQDLKYGMRQLLRTPGFAVTAALTLALGIGANTAAFSVVSAVLLRPLPVEAPEQIVSLRNVNSNNAMLSGFSYPNYRDIRDQNEVFSDLIAYRFAPIAMTHEGVSQRVWCYMVSGNYFTGLGLRPALGRLFTPADDVNPGGHPVAVVGYESWQKRFGARPDIVGNELIINGRKYTIVGVGPQGFSGTEVIAAPEIWFPVAMQADLEPGINTLVARGAAAYSTLGRIKPGISRAQVAANVDSIGQSLAGDFPEENKNMKIVLAGAGFLGGGMLRGATVGFAALLLAVAGVVLLLACANLSNMLLARATERREETAIRLALGASRGRLVRQLLTESMLLALIGGVVGILPTFWPIRFSVQMKPPADFPMVLDVKWDYTVLAFGFFVTLLTGVLFGLLPALQSTSPRVSPALNSGRLPGKSRNRLWNGLIAAQVGLSLVLLTGAGLMVRALSQVRNLELGYDPEGAVEVGFDLRMQGYTTERGREFQRQTLERVRSLPGVRAAGIASLVPVDLHFATTPVFIDGAAVERTADAPRVLSNVVSPGYFAAMGTRLLSGRDFSDDDRPDNERVAIVNQSFARKFWPNEDALGKRFALGGPASPRMQVIGIVQDGKYNSLNESRQPFAYRPSTQAYSGSTGLIVRSDLDMQTLVAAIRNEIKQLDPNLPTSGSPLADRLGIALLPARVALTVLVSFALVGLILAGIGIFGVISYLVSSRTRELGIRMALGAHKSDVLRLVIAQGMRPAVLGAVLGLPAAFAMTQLMRSFLFGLSAADPLTYIITVALLGGVAFLACYLPARRATRVDPLVALRYE